jgi:hypothetical protein
MASDTGATRSVFAGLAEFQRQYAKPVTDTSTQSPRRALESLSEALDTAPSDYQDYLREAVSCYEQGLYRGAVLMVWAATIQHLYLVIAARPGGLKAFESANKTRFGASRSYRQLKNVDDFLYMREADFIQLGEDAGLFNRNARKMLGERLTLRNLCGHPTRYQPGREEVVIFIESLLINVMGGAQLNW